MSINSTDEDKMFRCLLTTTEIALQTYVKVIYLEFFLWLLLLSLLMLFFFLYLYIHLIN